MPEITYKVKQKRQKQVHSISLAEELRFIAAQVLKHNLKKNKKRSCQVDAIFNHMVFLLIKQTRLYN